MPDKPPCPQCRRNKHVVPCGDRNHFCGHCQIEFNVEPGEDSTAGRNPSQRLEREQAQGRNIWRRR